MREAGRYGGDLLKFGGDALLLLFTGPEHELRAAAAAVGMQRALRPFGKMRHEAGTVSLRMSVGAATGEIGLFMVGESHLELLVTGPTCTHTLDMETAAEAGEILLHASLADAISPSLLGDERSGGRLLRTSPPVEQFLDLRASPGDPWLGVPESLRPYLGTERGEGEHRPATVAFLHFGGVDRLLDEDGPEALLIALDRLVTRTQHACASQQATFLGTDVAPNGGKILLATGAVQATDADQDRMLHAGRAIIDDPNPLDVRIGVNHGRIFSVDVGSESRRTFTVMGDAVNLAARVMGKAPVGTILATDKVLDRVRDQFATERLEPFLVKGKSEPVHAQLVGAGHGRRRAQSTTATELLGRDDELTVLATAVNAARQGHGQIVELVGEPGIGKSRLLSEFRSYGHDLPALVIEAGQYAAGTPYFAVRSLFRQLIGAPSDDDAETVIRLNSTLQSKAPELCPWAPLLAPVFGVELTPTPETEALAPTFRRARLHAAVSQLLSKLVSGPTLVTVEDIHWLDDPSRELLGHVLGDAQNGPVSVCLTRRPVGPPLPVSTATAVITLPLGPLAPEGALALVRAACEDAPADSTRAPHVGRARRR